MYDDFRHKNTNWGGGLMFGVLLVCTPLLFISCAGLFNSAKVAGARAKYVRDNNCTLVSEVKTGERVYCGRACTRDEMKLTYQCKPAGSVEFEFSHLD